MQLVLGMAGHIGTRRNPTYATRSIFWHDARYPKSLPPAKRKTLSPCHQLVSSVPSTNAFCHNLSHLSQIKNPLHQRAFTTGLSTWPWISILYACCNLWWLERDRTANTLHHVSPQFSSDGCAGSSRYYK